MSGLTKKANPYGAKLLEARSTFRKYENYYYAARTCYKIAKSTYDSVKQRFVWTIAIEEDDWLYADVHRWLLQTVTQKTVRSLTVSTKETTYDHEQSDYKRCVSYYSDDRTSQTVSLNGQKITVTLDSGPSIEEAKSFRDIRRRDRILFTSFSVEGRQAVENLLEELLLNKSGQTSNPTLFMAGGFGWRKRADIPPRSFDSVILRDGQVDQVRQDMRNFLLQEELYARKDMPWHRGYLFYGPPGTGKTSMARALATEFNLDVRMMPLGDIEKDASLIDLVSDVKPRSMLLLEDIDVFAAATSRDDDKEKEASLSGLLNALDGFATPNGLVVCMTTNDRSALDPALIRPGRVDMEMFVDYADDDQANRLFEHFYEHKPKHRLHVSPGISPAEISEVLKRNFTDADAAEKELHKLCSRSATA